MPNDQYKRRTILAALGALGLGAAATVTFREVAPLQTALDRLSELPDTDPLPAVFVGHGTPLGAIDPNVWTAQWAEVAGSLLRAPVASKTGLGIGLFQAARLAESAGYRLELETNRDDEVCFALVQGSTPAAIMRA